MAKASKGPSGNNATKNVKQGQSKAERLGLKETINKDSITGEEVKFKGDKLKDLKETIRKED